MEEHGEVIFLGGGDGVIIVGGDDGILDGDSVLDSVGIDVGDCKDGSRFKRERISLFDERISWFLERIW